MTLYFSCWNFIVSAILLMLQTKASIAKECDSNEIKVHKRGSQVESNGCSKPAGISVTGEEDFTYCCDRHDACYGLCGSDKEYCDKDFEKCMKSMCSTIFPRNLQCKQAAQMYAMGTMMFGQVGFSESQEQHCTCIPNSAPELTKGSSDSLTAEEAHYATLVEDFYNKYGLSEIERNSKETKSTPTEALVLKYSRGKKLPLYRLYYDLHKKYDNAILHTSKRRKMDPPRPPTKNKREKSKSKGKFTETGINAEL